jgi:hypothetical protein
LFPAYPFDICHFPAPHSGFFCYYYTTKPAFLQGFSTLVFGQSARIFRRKKRLVNSHLKFHRGQRSGNVCEKKKPVELSPGRILREGERHAGQNREETQAPNS